MGLFNFLSDRTRPSAGKDSAKEANRVEAYLSRGDSGFEAAYRQGLEACGMNDNRTRKQRFFNLVQFFKQTLPLEGAVAECGAWRGLSSYLLCRAAQKADPGFGGQNYHIFDSFEGLPAPAQVDAVPGKDSGGIEGKFRGSLEEVKRALAAFPAIQYHAGWIPQAFAGLPERTYKFVHVDVDLHAPTRAAFDYFYPRLAPKGILICDDYASPGWPGAKKAVDDFCRENGASVVALSTGQAALFAPTAALSK